MVFELSKKDKKIARQIIEKGLQTEYAKSLSGSDAILQKWKNKSMNDHDAYMALYKNIINCDRHIGRRYGYMTGSKYLIIIAGQLHDGIIDEKDLEEFTEEVKNKIKLIANFDS